MNIMFIHFPSFLFNFTFFYFFKGTQTYNVHINTTNTRVVSRPQYMSLAMKEHYNQSQHNIEFHFFKRSFCVQLDIVVDNNGKTNLDI